MVSRRVASEKEKTVNWRLCIAPLTLSVMAGPAGATQGDTAALAAAEDGYTAAVAGHDIVALGQTLSDRLVYVHASGQAQTKQEYLRGTVEGGFPVRRAQVLSRHAEVYGKTGITTGVIAYDVGQGEKPARYMAVYRKEGKRWLLLHWQNTRMPPLVPAEFPSARHGMNGDPRR